MSQWWNNFCESYGPAIVGGTFLCIADLMQNDRQGQIVKVGGIIKHNFLPQIEIEGWLGLFTVLILSAALCWVFRPATRGDAFAKGASVFAILAALVPAKTPPGASLDDPNKRVLGTLSSPWSPIREARAQSVIPVNPVAKARILISASNTPPQELERQVKQSGIDIWLIDPETGKEIAYERLFTTHFNVSKAPGKYIVELELEGFRRARAELNLVGDAQAYDLVLSERSRLPNSVQQLFPASRPELSVNRNETLKLQGAEASRRGDFAVAISTYDEALKIQAADVQTLNFKGYALYRLGKFEDSSKVLDSARKLDQDNFLIRLNYAKSNCKLGRSAEASKALFSQPQLSKQQLLVVVADGEFRRDCKELLDQESLKGLDSRPAGLPR